MDWEAVYRRHAPGIFQYLLYLAGQPAEAEDLLQETFLRAMRSAASLKEPQKVYSWLMTIARNQFLDQKKKQQRQRTDSLENPATNAANIKTPDENPEQYALNEEFSTTLQRTLDDFPEHQQTAFVLGIMQKRSYKEIADITGWSDATVKINIFRARKRMADALAEFQG